MQWKYLSVVQYSKPMASDCDINEEKPIEQIQSKCNISSRNQNLGYALGRGKGHVLKCKTNIFMSYAYLMSGISNQTTITEPLKH